jgi:hypothetical protein
MGADELKNESRCCLVRANRVADLLTLSGTTGNELI